MTKATAIITDRFKSTFVKTKGVDTTEIQRALFGMGFYFSEASPSTKRDVFRPHACSYLRVDTDGAIWRSEYMDNPNNVVNGCREVTAFQIFEAAEQVRKIKREESKASKKRRAQRKWEATSRPNSFIGCPVRKDVVVAAKLRNGAIKTASAGWLDWTYDNCGGDIVSYKVLEQRKGKPQPVQSSTVSIGDMVADIAAGLGKSVAKIDAEEWIEVPGVDVAPDTNPKKQYGLSAIPLEMWPDLASAYGALALYNGSLKYGKANFANTQVEASIYIAALRRHLASWVAGEEFDPVDGVPHLGGVLANVAILLSARAAGTLIDDRMLLDGFLKERDALKAIIPQINAVHAGKMPKHYTREVE